MQNQLHNIDYVRHGAARVAKANPTWHRTVLVKPIADPPLKWEKWQMQAKLALLAKENIALNTLLEPKPKNVQLPVDQSTRVQ